MEGDMTEIIEGYVEAHTDDLPDLLENLLAETESITGRSRWSIGKVEGKLLQMLIKISNTKRVVEVGTFTGFSALVMAEALPEDGVLTTCENSEAYADIALRYFNACGAGQIWHWDGYEFKVLHPGGASTPPGAGAHGMCGANAAARALAELGGG